MHGISHVKILFCRYYLLSQNVLCPLNNQTFKQLTPWNRAFDIRISTHVLEISPDICAIKYSLLCWLELAPYLWYEPVATLCLCIITRFNFSIKKRNLFMRLNISYFFIFCIPFNMDSNINIFLIGKSQVRSILRSTERANISCCMLL